MTSEAAKGAVGPGMKNHPDAKDMEGMGGFKAADAEVSGFKPDEANSDDVSTKRADKAGGESVLGRAANKVGDMVV